MKKLFLVMVLLNLAVATISIERNEEKGLSNVDIEDIGMAKVGACYLVVTDDLAIANEFQEALRKVQLMGAVIAGEKWVDTSSTWVIAKAEKNDIESYRKVVPGAYWILDGPKRNYLSLGLFKNNQNAKDLGRELSEKSLLFETLPYQQKVPQWQVEFEGVEAEGLINTYDLELIEKKTC